MVVKSFCSGLTNERLKYNTIGCNLAFMSALRCLAWLLKHVISSVFGLYCGSVHNIKLARAAMVICAGGRSGDPSSRADALKS